MGKNPHRDITQQEFYPQGFFPIEIFLQGIHPERNLLNGKVFFCIYSYLYRIWYMDPAQLLHVVVKQAVKLFFLD